MSDEARIWEIPDEGEVSRPPASETEIHQWEEARGIRLPVRLASALAVQNGGRVRGSSSLDLYGLGGIEPLEGEGREDIDEEGVEGDSPVVGRDRLFAFGWLFGCEQILDYRGGAEPGILILDHGMGRQLKGIGIATFDEFIEDYTRDSGLA